MPIRPPLLACLLCFLASSATAEDVCRPKDADRAAIGLVLGGGGARGSAHVGVIRGLEELRIPIDCIVGTSMGSLVGAMYATGMDAADLDAVIGGVDWERIFADSTPRQDQPFRRKRDDEFALFGPKLGIGEGSSVLSTGALSGQRISFLFESLVSERTAESRFSDLPIPFQAVAADIVTGERVLMDDGNLASAMRASMSVPGAFDPVERDGRLLVDGGIVDNLPIQVARDMGADLVIAVDVGGAGASQEDIRNVLAVVGQLFNLMVSSNVQASRATLREDDVWINPPLPRDFGPARFDRASEGVAIGYEAARAMSEELRRLSLSAAAYDRYLASRPAIERGPPVVDFVRLENDSRFSDELLLRRLDLEKGKALDVDRLERSIESIYGLGFLELVTYQVVEENDRRGVVLHVDGDARGTTLLEWGLDLFSDSIDEGYNLRAGLLKTDVDDLGSELRLVGQLGRDPGVLLDLWKYLDADSRWFVLPQLFAGSRNTTVFEEGDARATLDVDTWGGSFSIGRELSRFAVIDAGVRVYSGQVQTRVGPAGASTEEYDARELNAGWTFDRLDDRYIPGSGTAVGFDYVYSGAALDARDDYRIARLRGLTAHTVGRHTFWGLFNADSTVSGTAPFYAAPRGGGLFRLSGAFENEFAGQHFGSVAGSYQYRLGGSGLLAARLGVSVEYGAVVEDRNDLLEEGDLHGSLFLAYRSPLGPAYIGGGVGEGGQSRFFVRFGNVFSQTSLAR
ncbi:MAG: patatin-like phospholipase family protein [Pseudomonadales bacterium]|jgi:NTE family protein|nr:patatin-like phospholipase family protein [Pseudomonadales bacterium]